MYDKGMGTPPPTPQILFQMFDFYFHSWVDEVFSTYLKSEFWGLKLSSSRRAQTGVECVYPVMSHLEHTKCRFFMFTTFHFKVAAII